MKIRQIFLLALGVALPLWVRQYRFEQGVNAEVQRFATATIKAHQENVEAVEAILSGFAKKIRGDGE